MQQPEHPMRITDQPVLKTGLDVVGLPKNETAWLMTIRAIRCLTYRLVPIAVIAGLCEECIF